MPAAKPRHKPSVPAARGAPGAGTLGRQAHAALRQWLIAGELAPGDKLSLRTAAARLQVSVQPVREAVARLVADEALEVLPNRAVRVPVLDAGRFEELTLIRQGIEGFAVQRAATERSDAQLARMRRHEAAFAREQARSDPDLGAAIGANQALHFAAYHAAGLPALVSIIEGLWLRIGPLLHLDLRGDARRERMARSVRCHAQLVDGIARRDPVAACAGLLADIQGAAAHIADRLRRPPA